MAVQEFPVDFAPSSAVPLSNSTTGIEEFPVEDSSSGDIRVPTGGWYRRLETLMPGLFAREPQLATGKPEGILPRAGEAMLFGLGKSLTYAPFAYKDVSKPPPSNPYTGELPTLMGEFRSAEALPVTSALNKVLEQGNLQNVILAKALGPLFAAESSPIVNLVKAGLLSYFTKQGLEAITEGEKQIKEHPELTPGEKGSIRGEQILGGTMALPLPLMAGHVAFREVVPKRTPFVAEDVHANVTPQDVLESNYGIRLQRPSWMTPGAVVEFPVEPGEIVGPGPQPKIGGELVGPFGEVVAPLEESGGEISYRGQAGGRAIPTSGQAVQPTGKESGEQERLLKLGYVPSSEKTGPKFNLGEGLPDVQAPTSLLEKDVAEYQAIQQQMLNLVRSGQGEGEQYQMLWQRNEALKNKYGGKPPENLPSAEVPNTRELLRQFNPEDLFGEKLNDYINLVLKTKDRIALEEELQKWEAVPSSPRERTAIRVIKARLEQLAREPETPSTTPWPPEKFTKNQPIPESLATDPHGTTVVSNVRGALEALAADTKSRYSIIAQKLLDLGDEAGLSVRVLRDSPENKNVGGGGARGFYSNAYDHIVISHESVNYPYVILHEIIHALTGRKLSLEILQTYKQGLSHDAALSDYLVRGKNQAVKDIINAFFRAREQATDLEKKFYAFTDIQEFLAESLANASFQKVLDRMKYGDKTVWTRMKEAIAKMLGFQPREVSMLSHVIEKATELTSQKRPRVLEGAGQEGLDVLSRSRTEAPTAFESAREKLGKAKEYLKGGQAREYVPDLKFDKTTPLPDFGPKQAGNILASQPVGFESVPVIGRMLGTRAKIRNPQDTVAAKWQHEKYQVGPAVASALGEFIKGKINRVFTVSERGDMNVMKKTNEQSLKPSDVFESLMRDPFSYLLTKAQRDVFFNVIRPLLVRMHNLASKYQIIDEPTNDVTGNKGEGTFADHFPRIVTKHPKIEPAGPYNPERTRAFSTEQEGWSRGYEYDTNLERRLVTGTERLYRAMANQRLATDPMLRTRTIDQVVSDLKSAYAGELSTGAMTEYKIQRMAEGIQNAGRVMQPILFRKIFDRETAVKLNKVFEAERSGLRRGLVKASSTIKGLQLGFDFGVGQIQLLPTLYNNPKVWAEANFRSLRAMFNPEYFSKYAEQNQEAVSELTQLGSPVGRLTEYASDVNKGLLEKTPLVGPVARAFGRQFQTALDVAKIEMWKAYRDIVPPNQRLKAAQAIESTLMTSRMEGAGLAHGRAMLERIAFLAPSFYRGAMQFIGTLKDSGVSGQIARRAMGRFIGGGLLTYYAVGKMSGMDDKEILARLNPARTDFLMWDAETKHGIVKLGIGGIFRSVLRLAGKVFTTTTEHPDNWYSLAPDKNPLVNWYRGHAGSIVSLPWEAFSGRDYLGEESDITELSKRAFPLAAQQAMLRPGQKPVTPVEVGGQFFGLSTFPESFSMQQKRELQAGAVRKYRMDYGKLNVAQRHDIGQEVEQKMREIPKGMSPEKQREIALKKADERGERLVEMLPDSVKDWAKTNKVEITGYRASKLLGGSSLVLTSDETKRLEQLMKENYVRMLVPQMSNQQFSHLDVKLKQKIVNNILTAARETAWASLIGEINRNAGQGAVRQ